MARHILPDGLVIQAHVLDALASLPAESVQMCVTSPPYFGLRKYSGEQRTVWGGDRACEHEWNETVKTWQEAVGNWQQAENGDGLKTGKPQTRFRGDTKAANEKKTVTATDATCQRCGAWYGSYGLEDSPARWAEHTLEWLRAVRRVLRKDGTVWLNVGSSYAGGGNNRGNNSPLNEKQATNGGALGQVGVIPVAPGYKPLDLIDPFALLYPGLLADGWYVRSVVIWAKPNPMPESIQGTRFERHKIRHEGSDSSYRLNASDLDSLRATNNDADRRRQMSGANPLPRVSDDWADCPGCPKCAANDGLVLRRGSWRPTSSYEYVIMLAKSASYYSDGEGVREKLSPTASYGGIYRENGKTASERNDADTLHGVGVQILANPAGRNLRDVWELPTQPYSGAHFATYPEELVKRCILASTPDAGVCAVCGSPWARVLSSPSGGTIGHGWNDHENDLDHGFTFEGSHGTSSVASRAWTNGDYQPGQTLGWRPTCAHSEATPATILDVFGGSMTTAVVARQLGRRFVCIELSSDYVEMGLKRLERIPLSLPLVPAIMDSRIHRERDDASQRPTRETQSDFFSAGIDSLEQGSEGVTPITTDTIPQWSDPTQ